jgi:hypothetical protein
LLMICCFCLLSVTAQKIKRWLLGLDIEMRWELLRNRVGEDVEDQAWTLDWKIMQLTEPLHRRSLQNLSCHIFPSIWCLDLCSHISWRKQPTLSSYQPPDAKLGKVPELFGDSLMSD